MVRTLPAEPSPQFSWWLLHLETSLSFILSFFFFFTSFFMGSFTGKPGYLEMPTSCWWFLWLASFVQLTFWHLPLASCFITGIEMHLLKFYGSIFRRYFPPLWGRLKHSYTSLDIGNMVIRTFNGLVRTVRSIWTVSGSFPIDWVLSLLRLRAFYAFACLVRDFRCQTSWIFTLLVWSATEIL